MRHKRPGQKKLSCWLNPESVFLKKDVLNRLREYDLYEKESYKKYS